MADRRHVLIIGTALCFVLSKRRGANLVQALESAALQARHDWRRRDAKLPLLRRTILQAVDAHCYSTMDTFEMT